MVFRPGDRRLEAKVTNASKRSLVLRVGCPLPLLSGTTFDNHRDMPNNRTQPAHVTLRRFNKHLLNPLMLTLAGRRHWYASVIEHVGRNTGTVHRTPVVAIPTPTGLLIPLPYGADTDWLRNARTAGTATVTVGGERYEVVNPRVIDSAEAAPALPARRRQMFARFGIEQFAEFDRTTQPKEAGHDR